jgi:hypothetical protein
MQDPMEPVTLAGVMDDLNRRGFTEQFRVVEGRLRAVEHGKTFLADQIMIVEYHRFEGVSDPDDMAILYAIEARSGIRGTLADAFGVYSDWAIGTFMKDVAFGHPRQPIAAARRESGVATDRWVRPDV